MKAIGLLSGGLDSTLAVRMMVEQGVEVVAVKFTSPFCQCDSGGCCHAAEQARRMGVPLKTFAKGDDYIEVVRHPRHGWGSGINPCIDCRIFIENEALQRLRGETDSVLEVVGCVGPTVVLQGEVSTLAVQFAATVAVAYSDADTAEVAVVCRSAGAEQEIRVARPDRSSLQSHVV